MGSRLSRQRIARYALSKFVGRRREQQVFTDALDVALRQDTGPAPQIFLLHGEGGMGKTALVRRFIEICADASLQQQLEVVHVDFEEYKGRIRSSIDIMEILREKLEPRYCPAFDSYRQTWQSVRETRERTGQLKTRYAQISIPRDDGDQLDIKIGDSPQRVAAGKDIHQSEERVYIAPGGIYQKADYQGASEGEVLKQLEEQLDREKRDFKMWLRAQLTLEEWRIHENAQLALSKTFVLAINNILDQVPCVFLFDTYELVEQKFDTWMRKGLVYHTVDDNEQVLFVIAGRDNITRFYRDTFFEEFLYPVELERFSRLDIKDYLTANLESLPGDDILDRLVGFVAKTSRGVPLTVEGLVNALNRGVDIEQYFGEMAEQHLSVREIVADTAHRFLKYCLDRPGDSDTKRAKKQRDRDCIYTFAMLRDYEGQTEQERALDAIWKKSARYAETLSSTAVIKEYLAANYSFMFTSDGNMHPVVKEFTRTALREAAIPRGNLYRLNDAAIHYFKTKLDNVEGDVSTKVRSREWRETALSLLNHLFWAEMWEEAIRRLVRWYKLSSRYVQFEFRDQLLGLVTQDESLRTHMPSEYDEVIQALLHLSKWIGGSPSESVAAARLEQVLFEWLDRETQIVDLLDRAEGLSRKLQLRRALSKMKQTEELCKDSEFADERAKVYALIAKGYSRVGAPQKAFGLYHKAVGLDENCIAAHLGLAELHYSRGQLVEAIEGYGRVLDIDDKATGYAEERLHGIARLKERIEEYDFTDVDPSNAKLTARYLAFRGNIRAKRGQIALALEDYQRSTQLDPDHCYAQVKTGNALRQLGRTEGAFELFQDLRVVLRKKPKRMPRRAYTQLLASVYDGLGATHLLVGVTHSLGKHLWAAEENYKRAIKLVPSYVNALNGMGKVWSQGPVYAEAIRYFREALKHKADAYWVHNNLGIAYMLGDDRSQANSHFSRALRICREKLERAENRMLYHVHYNLALCLAGLGDVEASLKPLEEALTICNAAGVVNEFRSDVKLLGAMADIREMLSVLESVVLGRETL